MTSRLQQNLYIYLTNEYIYKAVARWFFTRCIFILLIKSVTICFNFKAKFLVKPYKIFFNQVNTELTERLWKEKPLRVNPLEYWVPSEKGA